MKSSFNDKLFNSSQSKKTSTCNSPRNEEEIDYEYSNLTKSIKTTNKLKFSSSIRSFNHVASRNDQDQCNKCSEIIKEIEKISVIIDSFISSMVSRANNYIYDLPLFNESLLNLDFLHSRNLHILERVNLPYHIKQIYKGIFVSYII